jgi:transposase InsO family protein
MHRLMAADTVRRKLEQAFYADCGVSGGEDTDSKFLILGSYRGSQFLSIGYIERMIVAGFEPSEGSTGDRYGNASVGPINKQAAQGRGNPQTPQLATIAAVA